MTSLKCYFFVALFLSLTGCFGPTAHWYLLNGRPFDSSKFDRDFNAVCYRAYSSNSTYMINMSRSEFDEMCMRERGWGVTYR
jgi:hypothetical protein